MRQREAGTTVHVPHDQSADAPVLRRSSERREIPEVEGGAQGNQPRHGLAAPRPFKMPPHRRAAHYKSYRISDIALAIITVICVASILWGYAAVYQVGYSAAEHYFTEVCDG